MCALAVGLFAGEPAAATPQRLTIAQQDVRVTQTPVRSITINGSLPGPTLYFREGEEAVVEVTNHLRETTSLHWHGLLVPGYMDGAPGFNGFPGIKPGETFTYRFPVRQAGTYWYHSHSGTQEQAGLYGAIVITPRQGDIHAEHDYVVLLSDFTEENSDDILYHLKRDAGYYNYSKRTVGDFFREIGEKGWKNAARDAEDWGAMRMSRTDLSDVSGYSFLVNGKTPEQNWTGLFKPGDRVRLRFINAASMTFFDVRIPGLKMTVIEADGQKVKPVEVDEFRIGDAETYDVIVEPREEKAYSIVAEPIDRSGFALATLAPHQGMKGPAPAQRKRALLTMGDMGAMPGMDMAAMMKTNPDMDMHSGWADADTPAGHRALSYADLRYDGPPRDPRPPAREITLRLNGNMERYIWTINGKKHGESAPLTFAHGERIRLRLINESMMAHPFHLHGMFVQLENGQKPAAMPNKHTVIVPPGQTVSVLLTADETGEWPYHCHLLYHMVSGMMTSVVVLPPGEAAPAAPDASAQPASAEGHHHAH